MGAWGIKSYSNDDTFDLLGIKPDDMTEHQINKSISRAYQHYFKKEKPDIWNKKTALLGTVVFCFKLGHNIQDKKCLEEALKIAKEFFADKDELANWNTSEDRAERLRFEIIIMEEILNG